MSWTQNAETVSFVGREGESSRWPIVEVHFFAKIVGVLKLDTVHVTHVYVVLV